MNTTYTVGKSGDIIPSSNKPGFDTLSRCHLSITATETPDVYRLIDLNSTNHSYYYDERSDKWVSFAKVRIAGDMPIRMGNYQTTVNELLSGLSIQAGNQGEPVELYLTPDNKSGHYRVVCSADQAPLYYQDKASGQWRELAGAILSGDTHLKLRGQEMTVNHLLNNAKPYRNTWGEICYSFTI